MMEMVTKPFYSFLTKIGITENQDKVLHGVIGFVIALTIGLLTSKPSYGVGTGIFIGVTKEIYDNTKVKGSGDIMDIFATATGAVLAGIVLISLGV